MKLIRDYLNAKIRPEEEYVLSMSFEELACLKEVLQWQDQALVTKEGHEFLDELIEKIVTKTEAKCSLRNDCECKLCQIVRIAEENDMYERPVL